MCLTAAPHQLILPKGEGIEPCHRPTPTFATNQFLYLISTPYQLPSEWSPYLTAALYQLPLP
ncbi:Uncharacterised protein [Serratia fonticola]|nr:Uncharacterised protein [Serratia fonticola]